MPFRMNFHDVPASEAARAECEGWAEALRVEFPEVGRVEVTVTHDRRAHDVHVHVTGKDIDVAARGDSLESLHLAARDAFDKAHAQLRKRHDKMVLGRRRNSKNERGS